MSILAPPFQLLEINLLSAQDLAPVSKSIKAYAVAWLNPERKLTTQIDPDGHDNPTWNEKFVFRVDDDFLQADDSAIMIEIYASAWLRDVLVGTVAVRLSNILNNRKSKVRFVALQVRRPSGRPQGILNIGVNLVDATKRSMPAYSELSSSAVGYWDIMDPKKQKQIAQNHHENQTIHDPNSNSKPVMTLQRSQSEKNESTITDYSYIPKQSNGYNHHGGDSEIGIGVRKGVIVNANGSLCSDVGPSPSVVAAAIAKGIYPLPVNAPRKPGNLVLEGWPEKGDEEVKMKNNIERWRAAEVPAVYDHMGKKQQLKKGKGKGKKGAHGRRHSGGGLFSCFGTALGCEFSITCGGPNRPKKGHDGSGSKAHLANASDITYDESSYL
ncbi:uncharacterized protein LOC130717816 [Lotus japonicus]|uniref:uncharacterized protein LOC130717816 n=1 Tax=Lotus japonicus TaxID=34305 RepID=UPI0025838618|nr:uncharacterized protein LOC130717816 [Lotus japonicus]